jgi:hypothetical protein
MPTEGQVLGKGWEDDFAKRMGGRLQPQSGSGPFAKLDVGAIKALWSLKATAKRTYSLSMDQLDEAIGAARGVGGPEVLPGMAIRFGERDCVLLLMDDLMAILERPEEHAIVMSKAKQRRLAAFGKLGDEDAAT